LQYYTDFPENVKVENGVLKITARLESYNGSEYTSGRIKTEGKFSFQYGRVDVRTKLPGGDGIWPANWMLGNSFSTIGWPACGEIDIMEYRGASPTIIQGSIHSPSSYGGTVNTGYTVIPTAETDFHIYSIEWDETKISFMVDYEEYYVYEPTEYNPDTWPFDAPFFVLLNVAVGGSYGGPVNNSIFPQTMEVDYVRVYQKNSN
jgi:beta-glucanase (GH16 family)